MDDYRDDPTCFVSAHYRDNPTDTVLGMVKSGNGFYSLPGVLLCRNCQHWSDEIARPELGALCGSLRICARGCVTHSGRWCS